MLPRRWANSTGSRAAGRGSRLGTAPRRPRAGAFDCWSGWEPGGGPRGVAPRSRVVVCPTARRQRCSETALTGTLWDFGGYPGVFPWVWKTLRVWRDNQDEKPTTIRMRINVATRHQDGIDRAVSRARCHAKSAEAFAARSHRPPPTTITPRGSVGCKGAGTVVLHVPNRARRPRPPRRSQARAPPRPQRLCRPSHCRRTPFASLRRQYAAHHPGVSEGCLAAWFEIPGVSD